MSYSLLVEHLYQLHGREILVCRKVKLGGYLHENTEEVMYACLFLRYKKEEDNKSADLTRLLEFA